MTNATQSNSGQPMCTHGRQRNVKIGLDQISLNRFCDFVPGYLKEILGRQGEGIYSKGCCPLCSLAGGYRGWDGVMDQGCSCLELSVEGLDGLTC